MIYNIQYTSIHALMKIIGVHLLIYTLNLCPIVLNNCGGIINYSGGVICSLRFSLPVAFVSHRIRIDLDELECRNNYGSFGCYSRLNKYSMH